MNSPGEQDSFDRTDLLLALLYAPTRDGATNSPIEGVTRLQKLMFLLLHDDLDLPDLDGVEGFDFEPYKMGPFSRGLRGEIDELLAAGIIKAEKLAYQLRGDADAGSGTVESTRYQLTRFGEEIAEGIWNELEESHRHKLSKFKSFFGSLTLRQLLIFVYERHPEFTTKSIIKDELGLTL